MSTVVICADCGRPIEHYEDDGPYVEVESGRCIRCSDRMSAFDRGFAEHEAMTSCPAAHDSEEDSTVSTETESRTPAQMVREFHEAFGLVIREKPDALAVDDEEVTLRRSLHLEEMDELHRAMEVADTVEVADALADLLYVLYGTGLHYGIDMDAVVAEVHRSNMTKLTASGTVLRRDDGKVLKPATFEPPRIAEVLGESS